MTNEIKHSRTGYVRGCRCEICVDANNQYQKDYMRQWRLRKRSERLAVAQKTASQV